MNDLLKLNEQVTEAWNRHDSKKFLSFLDDNIVYRDPTYPEPLVGKEKVEEYFINLVTAFPDFTMKTLNTVVEGNVLAVELEWKGTHKGPFKLHDQPELPPTNKKVIGKGSFFAKIRDGKTLEVSTYSDIAGMMIQLGIHELYEVHA
jgi:steroid delta-isomerase-like uncharacterized protein